MAAVSPRQVAVGVGLAVLASVAGTTAVWQRTRPATLVVSAVPEDAAIEVGEVRGTGRLDLGEVYPGAHAVRVSRRGYHDLKADIALRPGERVELRYTLIPRAYPLEVRGEGEVAVRQLGQERRGALPYAGDVLAGELELQVGEQVWRGVVDGAVVLCAGDALEPCP